MSATTTAKIDGDSTGLVSALDKGGKAMEGVQADARKLSDQLREVTDSADKAAGAMVQKIGGPGAIKAIAGIGAAVGIAKAGVEAFLGSSEALFRSYGEQGQKVWDETEKSLFAIKGAFAEAVLGGGSVEEMGRRLKSIFEGVKVILDALLIPVRLLSTAFFSIADGVAAVAAAQNRGMETEAKYQAAIAATTRSVADEKVSYDELLKTLGDVVISKQEAAKIEYESTLSSIDARLANNAEAREFRANAAADLAAAKALEAEIEAGIKDKIVQARRDVMDPNASRRVAMMDVRERARELLLADQSFQAQLRLSQNAAREAAYRDAAIATEEEKKREAELLLRRELFIQKIAELEYQLAHPPKAPSGGGGGAGGAAATADQAIEDAKEKARGVRFHFKWLARGIADDIAQAPALAAADAEKNAKNLATSLIERMRGTADAVKTISEESAEAKKQADLAAYNQWVGLNAKQIGVAIGSGKKMADIARASIGNIVSALGDKAFAEAGLRYAGGDLVGAAAMTAAGVAAYATAGLLGATAKKSAAATPAAAGPAAAPQNISYNLRVDAAFADGELVARQFARMQREAGRRGFAAGGAY